VKFLLALAFAISACGPASPPSSDGGFGGSAGAPEVVTACNAPIAVMPAGDSITCGTDGVGGYRAPLYTDLSADRPVQFVGPRDASACGGPGFHAGYPGITPSNWGGDGHGPAWIAAAEPNVVLMHLGTNSDGMGAAAYVANVVRPALSYAPKAVVIVALIISCDPMRTYEPAFNADLRSALESDPEYGTRIGMVDMSKLLDPAVDCATDKLHPLTSGYAKMSAAWKVAIDAARIGC
jgi:hypothetical protein